MGLSCSIQHVKLKGTHHACKHRSNDALEHVLASNLRGTEQRGAVSEKKLNLIN